MPGRGQPLTAGLQKGAARVTDCAWRQTCPRPFHFSGQWEALPAATKDVAAPGGRGQPAKDGAAPVLRGLWEGSTSAGGHGQHAKDAVAAAHPKMAVVVFRAAKDAAGGDARRCRAWGPQAARERRPASSQDDQNMCCFDACLTARTLSPVLAFLVGSFQESQCFVVKPPRLLVQPLFRNAPSML